MSLSISKAVYDEIVDAARKAAPLEACGLLAGNEKRVTKCYALTNVDAAADHYSMEPAEQFAAVKDMRARGLKIMGVWHSHPTSPPRMSPEDLRLAFTPEVIYVVVSLAGKEPSLCGYEVIDGAPKEVGIVVE